MLMSATILDGTLPRFALFPLATMHEKKTLIHNAGGDQSFLQSHSFFDKLLLIVVCQ